MESNDQPHKIEDLKKKLSQRGYAPTKEVPEFYTRPKNPHASQEWFHEDDQGKIIKMSLVKKIFLGSIIFFILVLGLAAYQFFSGSNIVSGENIEIKIEGPASLSGGEELNLQVSIENRNAVTLESVDLLVEYPPGTRATDNTGAELPRVRKFLGTLAPGQVVNELVSAVIFGEKGSTQEIVVSLEYRTSGSNAIFVREERYAVSVISSPAEVSVTAPPQVSSGQEFEVEVKVSSRTSRLLKGLVLKAQYPTGFKVLKSLPVTTGGNDLWLLGDLEPAGERMVRIRGVIEAAVGSESAFLFSLGPQDTKDARLLSSIYDSYTQLLPVSQPFLGLSLTLNGSQSSPYLAGGGQLIQAKIDWSNNLSDRLLNARLTVQFSGNALNKSSVSVTKGFYQSATNIITLDKQTLPEMSVLDPGQRGELTFSFSPHSLSSGAVTANPTVGLEVVFEGVRALESEAGREVEARILREVKVGTALQVAPRAVYSIGPFTNSGPLPPRVDTETTYTIIWSVTNPSSNVTGAKVSAKLPSYVNWLGKVSPSGADVKYNQDSREVVWSIGSVKAGTGFSTAPLETAFQVVFLPSITQVNSTPTLVSEAVIAGRDEFAGGDVTYTARPVTIRLSTDPAFTSGQDIVVNK